MDLIWNLHQRSQIRALQSRATTSQARTSTLGEDLTRIEDRLERLLLINQAMWELLAERTELGEQDLVDKIREVDLRDGVEDGKMTTVLECPKCRRTMSQRHKRCLYCGGESLEATPFEKI